MKYFCRNNISILYFSDGYKILRNIRGKEFRVSRSEKKRNSVSSYPQNNIPNPQITLSVLLFTFKHVIFNYWGKLKITALYKYTRTSVVECINTRRYY